MTDWGLTELQIATIDAIVGVFEGGHPFRYETVARVKSDPGGLSFGKHQVSHTSGNLYALMDSYCGMSGADSELVSRVKKQLPRLKVPPPQKGDKEKQRLASLEAKRQELIADEGLCDLLAATAADRAMGDAQDKFFFDQFMVPALTKWQSFGFKKALSAAAAYDSQIQSGQAFRAGQKEEADMAAGAPSKANEEAWVAAYCDARRKWLSESSSDAVRGSVYRMDSLKDLIAKNAWDLSLPLHVNGYDITAWDDFSVKVFEDPYRRAGFEQFGVFSRNSKWTGRGRFVNRCLVSLRLLDARPAKDLGKFDDIAVNALKKFQTKCGVNPSGAVDAETFDKLCAEAAAADAERAKNGPATADGFKALPPGQKTGAPIGSTVASGAAIGGAAVAAAVGGSGDDGSSQQPQPASAVVSPGVDNAIAPAAPAANAATATSPVAANTATPPDGKSAAPATPSSPQVTPATHPGSVPVNPPAVKPIEEFLRGPIGTTAICIAFILAVSIFAFAHRKWS